MNKTAMLIIAAMTGIAIHAADFKKETEIIKAGEIRIDDGSFTGCFHDAFEGVLEKAQDGTVKRGKQGIMRTKGVLYGAGTGFESMSLNFSLDKSPEDMVKLSITGLDDHFPEKNPLKVEVNGKVLTEISFPDNDISKTGNSRYLDGWKTISVEIPKGYLKSGANTLKITNTKSVFDSERWPHAFIDDVVFSFPDETAMTFEKNNAPIFYFGLEKGMELNLWPTVNVGNKLCLIQGGDIECNFFVTFPQSLAPKNKDNRFKTMLKIETDGDIEITGIDGKVWQSKKDGGITVFSQETEMRVIGGSTPHPAQGVSCFIRGLKTFEGKYLNAWYETDGMPSKKQSYMLRSVSLKPVAEREKIDFLLSIWGGQIPAEPERMRRYIDLVKSAGFNQMFTGEAPDLNKKLKDECFLVYPRYGWFGHQYKVSDANRQFAAVGADGKPLQKDFCPQAILDNPADPEMGKYFRKAKTMGALQDIAGLCVDFECPPVWCWCDRCMDRFRKESGIQVKDRSELTAGGKYEDDYRDFGRRLNRDLLAEVSRIMKKENPSLKYYSLASASDMPAYWWDGRSQGRHAIRELVKFADEIAASGYFYEIPGGLKSVRPMIAVIRDRALQEGRSVNAGLISPLATTVSEYPRYRGAFLRPDMLRLLILLVGTGNGHGLSLFRGDCFDGEHYLAAAQGMEELVRLKPYTTSGVDRSFELTARPVNEKLSHIDLTVSHHLISRLEWRPEISYYYDAVQLFRDDTGRDRVIILFNYSSEAMKMQIRITGLFDKKFAASDFITGENLGTVDKSELESGRYSVDIKPRNCRIIRLSTLAKPNSNGTETE